MKSIKGPLNFKCYSKRYLPTRKGQYEPGCYEPKLIHKRHTFLLLPLSARSVCRLLLRVTVREDRGRPERRAGDSRCVTCPPMGSRCRVQWMKRCKDFLNTRFLMVQTPASPSLCNIQTVFTEGRSWSTWNRLRTRLWRSAGKSRSCWNANEVLGSQQPPLLYWH